MLLSFLAAAALQAQTPPPVTAAPPPRRPPSRTIVRDSSPDSTGGRRSPRRAAVTAELMASAFKSAEAKALYEKARRARIEQDSAIRNYYATVRQRISFNAGIAGRGREHLIFRRDAAGRVAWQHDVGAWIDVTGAKVGIPVASKREEVDALMSDLTTITPIPYYPGYEALWLVGDETGDRVEANDRDIVNPLTIGAEAYYTFAVTDSVTVGLADGTKIRLREMEVRPRSPKWNLAVGSFWFDDEGRLVKCAYRLAVPLDIWTMAREQMDSTDEMPPKIVQGFLSPMRMQITGIAIEYSLMQGRFWLPSMRSMTGDALMLFARMPASIEQRFAYQVVNGPDTLPRIDSTKLPTYSNTERSREWRDSVRTADSTRRAWLATLSPAERRAARDSINRRRDSINGVQNGRGDSIGRARNARIEAYVDSLERGLNPVGAQVSGRSHLCDSTGTRVEYARRFDSRMPVATRIPCSLTTLMTSPDLPASVYDAGDEMFSLKDGQAMIAEALTLAAQAPLSLGMLPPPSFAFGLPMTRFNRIEGLSTGLTIDQQLGAGLSVGATGRFGFADRDPNVELVARRSNLSKTLGLGVYHRLVSANDWGAPLSFGNSFSGFMFGKDEGFYYKASGADLSWTRGIGTRVEWRLFAEKQTTAAVKSSFALFGDPMMTTNLLAEEGTWIGSSLRMVKEYGHDPRGFRMLADLRLEGGQKDSAYGRGAVDLTMSRGLPFLTAGALTLAGGSSVGSLPMQRAWFLGGTQTVRGQNADVTQSGNAFLLGRLELARDHHYYRTILFGDLGWTGDRDMLTRMSGFGRPFSGVGIGQSMMDGIIRVDLSRGLYPRKQWRFDVYLEARF